MSYFNFVLNFISVDCRLDLRDFLVLCASRTLIVCFLFHHLQMSLFLFVDFPLNSQCILKVHLLLVLGEYICLLGHVCFLIPVRFVGLNF